MQKYYYQEGRCEANHYLSLNPVLYKPTDEKGMYQKSHMVCRMIQEGKCDKAETCQLLLDAPELMKYDRINLRDKKMDE